MMKSWFLNCCVRACVIMLRRHFLVSGWLPRVPAAKIEKQNNTFHHPPQNSDTPASVLHLFPLHSSSLLSFLNQTLQPHDLSSMTWTRSILLHTSCFILHTTYKLLVCVEAPAQAFSLPTLKIYTGSSVEPLACPQQLKYYWLDNDDVSAELQGKSSHWRHIQCQMD